MDLTAIQNALALVSTAVTATGQAATTADAFKKLFASGKPSDEEGAKLVNTLATQLTTANMMNVQLSDTLKTIQKELQQNDEFEKEKQRYQLIQTPADDIVYHIRDDMRNGQPDHYICPVCLSDKIFSFVTGGGDFRHCQRNREHRITFNHPRPLSRSSSRNGLTA